MSRSYRGSHSARCVRCIASQVIEALLDVFSAACIGCEGAEQHSRWPTIHRAGIGRVEILPARCCERRRAAAGCSSLITADSHSRHCRFSPAKRDLKGQELPHRGAVGRRSKDTLVHSKIRTTQVLECLISALGPALLAPSGLIGNRQLRSTGGVLKQWLVSQLPANGP